MGMATTNTAARIETHPFAGFGPAPYRVVKVEEKLFAIPGEAARPCGCCDVCCACLRWVFTVRAANGVEFATGCDCALKAGMTLQEIKEARRGYRNAKLEAERAAYTRESNKVQREANKAAIGYALTDKEIWSAQTEGQEIAKAWLRAERKYNARHIGEVGKRARGLELAVERCMSFDNAFCTMTIWICRDRAGNQVVYKSSGHLLYLPKDGRIEPIQSYDKHSNEHKSRWFTCDATVKEHGEYKGMLQTVIQRAKVTGITSDWFVRD